MVGYPWRCQHQRAMALQEEHFDQEWGLGLQAYFQHQLHHLYHRLRHHCHCYHLYKHYLFQHLDFHLLIKCFLHNLLFDMYNYHSHILDHESLYSHLVSQNVECVAYWNRIKILANICHLFLLLEHGLRTGRVIK